MKPRCRSAMSATAAVPTDTSALRDAVTAEGIMEHLGALQAIADANGGTRASGTPGFDASVDEIEDQLFSHGEGVSRRIFKLQREVIDLQHATSPLPGMLVRVQDELGDAESSTAPAFHEVEDAARHVTDRVDAFRRTLESALGVHATLVEQANNDAMRRMTEHSITQNDQVVIVMEWVEGNTLATWERERARSWREVVAIYAQAGQGLAAADGRGAAGEAVQGVEEGGDEDV